MATSDIFNNLLGFINSIDLNELGELDSASFSVIKRLTMDPDMLNPSSALKLQAVLDFTYEKINIGIWKEVSPYLRKTMTVGAYLKLLIIMKGHTEITKDILKEAYQVVDNGLLFGCPLNKEPMLLQRCAAILNGISANIQTEFVLDDSSLDNKKSQIYTRFKKVDRVKCPSLESFYNDYIVTETPVILTDCIDHWPALTRWKDNNYLLRLAGFRTVPIEVGRQYTDHEWTQKLMTIEDFIKNHIYKTDKRNLGYLAQYQLFDHIPELLQDISKPDYCCFFSTNDDNIDINAWYGPKGTVSPLHQDPKKNLFTQIIGEKSVYLFPPTDTPYLYPHKEDMINNTSVIDPRETDFKRFPQYINATGQHCVLRPGEMLYIPTKWWHFVESMTVSFSVSFWWT